MKYLSIADAEAFISKALQSQQVPAADADIIANLMVKSDVVGADGHGIFRLPAYLKRALISIPIFGLSVSKVQQHSLMVIMP